MNKVFSTSDYSWHNCNNFSLFIILGFRCAFFKVSSVKNCKVLRISNFANTFSNPWRRPIKHTPAPLRSEEWFTARGGKQCLDSPANQGNHWIEPTDRTLTRISPITLTSLLNWILSLSCKAIFFLLIKFWI